MGAASPNASLMLNSWTETEASQAGSGARTRSREAASSAGRGEGKRGSLFQAEQERQRLQVEEVTEEWGCTGAWDGEGGRAGALPGWGVTRPEGSQWDMVRSHSRVTRPVGHHPHPAA